MILKLFGKIFFRFLLVLICIILKTTISYSLYTNVSVFEDQERICIFNIYRTV